MDYSFVKRMDKLAEACDLVESELRKLRITHVQLEYSDGVSITGEKGFATDQSLWHAIFKLRQKLGI